MLALEVCCGPPSPGLTLIADCLELLVRELGLLLCPGSHMLSQAQTHAFYPWTYTNTDDYKFKCKGLQFVK